MKNERFVEDAEPYNLYCKPNAISTYVGDGLPDVPKQSFCNGLFFVTILNSVIDFIQPTVFFFID